jgi:hypothetical protein
MRKYQQHLVNSCVSLQTRRFHTKLSYSENSVLPVHKKSVFNTIVPHIQIVNSVLPVHKNSVLLHKKISIHTLDEGRAAQTFPHIQINN